MTQLTTAAGPRQNKVRRRKAVVAAACGFALLLGGSTFALWSDSFDLEARKISTGTFDLTNMSAEYFTAYDITPHRGNKPTNVIEGLPTGASAYYGHEIPSGTGDEKLTTFGMVPGDKILLRYKMQVTLKGDNLVADLKSDIEEVFGNSGEPTGAELAGMNVGYEVFAGASEVGATKLNSPDADGAIGTFAAANVVDQVDVKDQNKIDYVVPSDTNLALVWVLLTIEMDGTAVTGTTNTTKTVDLTKTHFDLVQSIEKGGFTPDPTA
jgi:alternate signal-mediated exported protein